jgi:hypothetical protein
MDSEQGNFMKYLLIPTIFIALLACAACAKQGPHLQETPSPLEFQRADRNRDRTLSRGDWTYVLHIRNPGTRSEGSEGHLFYRGEEIGMPENLRDYYETPLGIFRHTGINPGQERYLWDDTGWMLQPGNDPGQDGRALAWPQTDAD